MSSQLVLIHLRPKNDRRLTATTSFSYIELLLIRVARR